MHSRGTSKTPDPLRRSRPSGRVGASRQTPTRDTITKEGGQKPDEMLRLYAKLRELNDMGSSELCKAIDYSLKIFGLVGAPPCEKTLSIPSRLAENNEPDQH